MIKNIENFFAQLFGPLTDLLGSGLNLFHSYGAPWWLSIIFLTVVVRGLLFPLTLKQVKSMRAMQDLKPEMDKIRSKYKDNRQKQQEELMKLYQDKAVNPLGGCLPLLVQMPIFLGMYYVIRNFEQTVPSFSSGGILWFTDLTKADPYYILPVVSALTLLASQEIVAKTVDPQQRMLMRLLPVVFAVFMLNFPAGLFVYWITSNVVTLFQNYLIYNHGPGQSSTAVKAADPEDDRPGDPALPSSEDTEPDKPAPPATQRVSSRKRRKKRKR